MCSKIKVSCAYEVCEYFCESFLVYNNGFWLVYIAYNLNFVSCLDVLVSYLSKYAFPNPKLQEVDIGGAIVTTNYRSMRFLV